MPVVERPEAVRAAQRIAGPIERGEELSHRLGQLQLVVFGRQHVVALGLRNLCGNVGLAAHGVDRHHRHSGASTGSSAWIAVISFDFFRRGVAPRSFRTRQRRPTLGAKRAARARYRRTLPLMAITRPANTWHTPLTQLAKHCSSSAGECAQIPGLSCRASSLTPSTPKNRKQPPSSAGLQDHVTNH